MRWLPSLSVCIWNVFSKSHNSKFTPFIPPCGLNYVIQHKVCHLSAEYLNISKRLFTHTHTHMSGNCCGTFAPVPSLTLAGVLAALCDHKPWPHHPRDPAGDCQGCHGTSPFVALTVRVTFLLPRAAAQAWRISGVDDVDSGPAW